MVRSLLMWALPSVALAAVPATLTHQGRLLDATGRAIEGAHDIRVTLYDTQASPGGFWTKNFASIPIQSGYYAVTLATSDSAQPIDPASFNDGEVWVAVAVDGVDVGPRERIAATGYSFVAANASSGGGGQVPAGSGGSCTTEGSLTWNAASDTLYACNGTTNVVVWNGGPALGSGDFHVAIDNMTFPTQQSVFDQGWTCEAGASPWTSTPVPHLHIHNQAGRFCQKDVTGLLVGREYELSFRRFSRDVRITLQQLDGAGTVVSTLHQRNYSSEDHTAGNVVGGENVLTRILFAAPATGRIRIKVDDVSVNDGGITNVDLRTTVPLTTPHMPISGQFFNSAAQVFSQGWDSEYTNPWTTGPNHMHIHNQANRAVWRYERVVPGATYTLSFTRYANNGRVRVFSVDQATNNNVAQLTSASYSPGSGVAESVTFTAPATGFVRIEFDNPSTNDFGVSQISLSAP
jgi:hypothetical protein